jgi:hypothetical protein
MVVAMDIEQGGPMAWVQACFAGAQPGSNYEAVIHKELNAFSNNMWSKIWDKNEPILAMPSVEVHLGYYTEESGERRDIRALDYLEMLRKSRGQNEQVLQDYRQSLAPGCCDRLAMHKKREVLKSWTENFVCTGLATRIFFNTRFINALEHLFASCNLRIVLEGLNDVTGYNQHASAFQTQYMGTITGHGAFQQNYGNVGNFAPVNHFNGMGFFNR